LKFFEKKKSFKKNKILKFVAIKYFRKLFIIANVWKLVLTLKNNPVLFQEMLFVFNQPIFLLLKQENVLRLDEELTKEEKDLEDKLKPILANSKEQIDKDSNTVVTPKNIIKQKYKTRRLETMAPKFVHIYFLNTKSYVISKTKKKGRIKRKITKKLIKKNRVVD